jgi:hypothetical protein
MNSSNDLSSQNSHFTEAQRPESTQELIDQLGLDRAQTESIISVTSNKHLNSLQKHTILKHFKEALVEHFQEDEYKYDYCSYDEEYENLNLEYVEHLEQAMLKYLDTLLEKEEVEDAEVAATSSAVQSGEISSSRPSVPLTQMSNDDDRMTPPIFITPSPLKRSASQAFPSEYTYSGPRHRDTHFLVLGMPHPRGCYKVLIEGDVPGHPRFTRACMLPGRYPHPLEGLDEESGTFETQPLITAEERAEFPEVYPNPYPEPEVVDLTDSAPAFPISCAGQTVDLSEEDRPTATQEAREVMEESIAATCEVDDEYLETGDTVF